MFKRVVHPGEILADELAEMGMDAYGVRLSDRSTAEPHQPDHCR